jgi:DNA-binding response OmpR family regulator
VKSGWKILFVDNTGDDIRRTIEPLYSLYRNIHLFKTESEFMGYIAHERADLIFMNLHLQPNDAIMLLKEIQGAGIQGNPFIVLYSDRADDFAQEIAFNSGADAFINFHRKLPIMQAFIRNILRRKAPLVEKKNREFAIDTESYLVYRNGKSFQLPRKEFKIIQILNENPGTFMSKERLAVMVWQNEAVAKLRTIDVHIYNIRQMLGKNLIQSAKGRGYRLNQRLLSGNQQSREEV